MGLTTPSNSEWAANVVLVPKKAVDGGPKTMRSTTDYRDFSKINKRSIYPMPNIQALLDCLGGSSVYSSMDLFNGFWNLQIRQKNKQETAFRVPGLGGGIYQFERLPFGLQGPLDTFSRVVNEIFSDVVGIYVLPSLDDFEIFSKNFEDHLSHLEDVLKRVQLAGLKAKPSKCHFGKDRITFLDFQTSSKGVEPLLDKIETVQSFERPTTVKQLKSFLGLTGSYRRFIKDYATIADRLSSLTTKCSV